ncbi:3-deoxy-7-phosphoheptulonate synthase [Longimicrobium terrae]|uniref:3-deoxy-7-phosphoheptulonate synthase n=1 Tax=Longimicrobium terrae TaxID=1639882 RepID=A0A841GTB0_9BACT|nr:3-deoxy-7-phosphoheptulonate synthase [Longimicrobium terrae]MBB4635375.1 3-deoxy-7-phosphoheptulonate synthase [Longimicrobium terrae]MBB6069769.1 3-deoxy-7-phosphoheptulonate synthase [Longimicrobium terrae]NNC31020.1 3-deoxy-7-phosphoheptulonate synthase [Longimicrobium terrae]
MIIVTRPAITDAELDHIRERVETLGMRTHLSRGEARTIIGCIGDESRLQEAALLTLPGVESVHPVMKPYKLASREFSADRSVIRVGDAAEVGGRSLAVIAGPCSVEGRDMLRETAFSVASAGAGMLRGGAFKPRTSPYAFQGLGEAALRMLADVRAETGLPIVTEVMDTRQVELVAEYADVLQIGARNMQNFALLSEVGRVQRPVLLKRGLSATVQELLMAAEYVMAQGNRDVILCERGIRTFETATRNTLDVAAIPVLKAETHLPVMVDPSHAGGRADLVAPLSFAAIAAGADGLIVEVHPCPEQALSDGDQSLTLAAFEKLMIDIRVFADAVGRTLAGPTKPWRAEAA